MRGYLSRACFALILAVAAAAAEAKAPAARSETKAWIAGPVRYIARADEIKLFKNLESDADRAAFIARFWQLRDPTPDTQENEYRSLFWRRVKEANQILQDTTDPGWKTDRGKIYVLCGPPSRIQIEPFAETKAGPGAGRGLIRWIYEGRPCGRNDIGPVVVVPFVRHLSGDYELSTDPRLSALSFDVHDLTDPAKLSIERWLSSIGADGRSELGVMADLGKLQEGVHPEEIIVERVETSESYGSYPIAADLERYRHPHGGTLAVLTVSAPIGRPGASAGLIARFSPRDPSLAKRFVGEESFRLEGEGANRVAQARIVLEPATWDVTVLVANPDAEKVGLFRGVVEVTKATEGLALSDVTLAAFLEPLAYASLASHDEPFQVGSFRVVPRTSDAVNRGSPLMLFYEIYGGVAPYTITYQLEGRDVDGGFRALGPPATRDGGTAAQGWSLDTAASWPLGEYRVKIRVADASGTSVEATRGFRLD